MSSQVCIVIYSASILLFPRHDATRPSIFLSHRLQRFLQHSARSVNQHNDPLADAHIRSQADCFLSAVATFCLGVRFVFVARERNLNGKRLYKHTLKRWVHLRRPVGLLVIHPAGCEAPCARRASA